MKSTKIFVYSLLSALTMTAVFTHLSSADENCIECHADVLEKVGRHEAAVYGCDSCHAGHEGSSDRPANLLGAVNDLCLQCHDLEKVTECHPGPGKKKCGHPIFGHPVSGPRDPLYKDKEFNCASCHNPHSAQMGKLFRYDYSEGSRYQGNFCVVCHWEYAFPGEQPPTPPWSFK